MQPKPNSSLDPDDWTDLRQQGHQMLDDMFDYIEHIGQRPVWQPIPDAVRQAFDEPLPHSATPLAQAHTKFMTQVLPYAAANSHPRFMGWVQGGGTPVGMLAEMLAAGLNANLGGRDQMALEVERQIVHWMRDLFGFPDTASGLFVTGSSTANLMGVLVARTRALGVASRITGVGNASPLVAYAASTAHSCISKAMEISGLGNQALRLIAVNAQDQIDTQALTSCIATDRAAGLQPFLLIGTAGTVNTGAIDDLETLADIAYHEQLWFHVDGALGALGMLAPSIAPRLKGIARADSLALDFHKWGQVPYDAGFFMVRDGTSQTDTFASPAAYLTRHTRGIGAGSPWPCDLGFDLSRSFRALKTWFTLVCYGTDKIGAVIAHTCALAQTMQQRLQDYPDLELMAPVALNIVCFRFRCDDADAVNAEIVADLHESGIAVPSVSSVNGHTVIRAAIVNHRAQASDIDALLDAAQAMGRQRLAAKAVIARQPTSSS